MTEKNSRNTEGIEAYRKKKQEDCAKRVNEAISKLAFEGKNVSFNSVSELAGVSKKYLYEHHYERIDGIRTGTQKSLKQRQDNIKTDKSKDIIIQAKIKRIRELEDQIAYLENLVKKHLADTYDNV